MSDVYSTIFAPDEATAAKAGILTYPQLEARRRIAAALATRNRPYPKTIGEGLSALGEGLGEGMIMGDLQRAELAQAGREAAGKKLLEGGGASAPSVTPQAGPGRSADAGYSAYASAPPPGSESNDPLTLAQADQQPQMPIDEWVARIARNEKSPDMGDDPYSYIGEQSRSGDYEYGKYRVMGARIPVWTRKFLGVEMTPQEFLADPKAQEQVARGKGSEYISRFGPVGAAAAWYAGVSGMNDQSRPDLMAHVADYKQRFMAPIVTRDQVAASVDPENARPFQVASLGDGVQVPETARPDTSRDNIVQALAGPPPQAPPPDQVPPQQVAQAQIGPAPQAVPPSQTPLVKPQDVPKEEVPEARPIPAGREPQLRDFTEGNPVLKQKMDDARKVMLDTGYGPALNKQAEDVYKELERRANDAYTKAWTVWNDRRKVEEAFDLKREENKLQVQKLRGEVEDAAENRILSARIGFQNKDEFFKGMDKDKVAADLASRVMDDNRIILKAFKEGAIMGSGAGWRINAAKLASFALNNGYASEMAANNEIMRALGGSRIREQLANVNPVGVASNTDLLLSRQMSGTEPTMEPKAFLALLHKSSSENAKLLNKFEEDRDYYLGGTRAEQKYKTITQSTGPKAAVDDLLAHRDDKTVRAKYDDTYGEGTSALEIERFKRRQRRGGQ